MFPIKKKLCTLVLLTTLTTFIQGQISHSGKPLFNPQVDTLFVPVINIEEVVEDVNSKDYSGVHLKSDKFAETVELNIDPFEFGAWYDYSDEGVSVCLLKIDAGNSSSLSIFFDEYELNPGYKIFIYNPNQTQIIGALTYQNNKSWQHLATSTISGGELYLEIQVLKGLNDPGLLRLGEVYVGYKKTISEKSTTDEWYGTSKYCEVNVNCSTDAVYQKQKQAVCRIVYGSNRCTGTVLNNLKRDQTPYVLSAAHCFTAEATANKAVFDFNYESPTCESEDVELKSISGASVVSYSENLDFLLLKLSENIPADYEVLYSGWDARGISSKGAFTIHHPEGDIKKISIEEDTPYTTTYAGYDDDAHWAVYDYEVGSTEPGSSGAGLVSANGKLIGTLTGGGSACSNPINDRYQKFSSAYNDYEAADEQLKAWLDPLGTNVLTCTAMSVSDGFRNSAEVLTNVTDSVWLELKQQEEGWGYVSGHNYQENSLFAEKFELTGSMYLYGAIIWPWIVKNKETFSSINFNIWSGEDKPSELIYSQKIYIDSTSEKEDLEVDFDSTILIHKGFFAGFELEYQGDTFAIRIQSTTTDDNTAFTYINNNWVPLQFDGNSYMSHMEMKIMAFDFLPDNNLLPDTASFPDILIYPNPSSEFFNVYFKSGISGEISFELYNISGVMVYHDVVSEPIDNYPVIHNLDMGVYILQIKQNNKLIKVRKVLVY